MAVPAPRNDAIAEHTLRFSVDPQHAALIVVDMQYASACRATGLGRWLAERGRAAEGDYRFDRIEQLLIPNIRALLTAFRTRSLPCLFVRIGPQLPNCLDLVEYSREVEAEFRNWKGNREYEFLEELSPEAGDIVIDKLSSSAFTSSNIDSVLRHLGVTTTVFCGVATAGCVDLTARDASDRGYRSIVVEDAVAEDRPEYHECTLQQFQRLFGRVISTGTVISELTPRHIASRDVAMS